MNTADILSLIKASRACDLARLAESLGIGVSTLHAMKYGRTTDPRGSTLDKLREHYLTAGCELEK
jgi:DNA-binding Xre family transcriptional regulator